MAWAGSQKRTLAEALTAWEANNGLMLGKIEGRRGRGQQRIRWLDGFTNLMDMSLGKPGVLQSLGS